MKARRLRSPGRVFLLSAVLVLVGTLATPSPQVVSAHPLGNFTINRYSRIDLAAGQIYLRYVVDMAEIPTFQEMASIDQDQDGQISEEERASYLQGRAEELQRRLHLSIDQSPVPLQVVAQELDFRPGQGGLPTLRLSLLLQSRVPQTDQPGRRDLYYRDDNYAQRLGWKEIVVTPGGGIALLSSTVPQQGRSDELRSYPQDMLNSPPDHREARVTFTSAGAGPGGTGATGSPAAAMGTGPDGIGAPSDALTSLIAPDRLTLPVILFSVVLAVGLGAFHAMSPGHGKTVMAAYLVGTRGTPLHALFLGLTVTISHTLGVLALGLVTLYASRLITPERLYPWLSLASGGIVLAIGVWLLLGRWRDRQRSRPDHDHTHTGHHRHFPMSHTGHTLRITWRSLAALGVVGGLLPSASALVILLAAISLHRIGFGLLLIFAFSAGMAAVLSGIGLLLVYGGRLVERFQAENRLVRGFQRALPLTAALMVLLAGMVVTTRAVLQTGLW